MLVYGLVFAVLYGVVVYVFLLVQVLIVAYAKLCYVV